MLKDRNNSSFYGCLYGRRDVFQDGTFARTGRSTGSRHACISLKFITFRLYGDNVSSSGVPVPSTGLPAKAGQFLSCKHTVPLCRDDIMTLQIVPGRNIQRDEKRPIPANVPSRLPYKQPLGPVHTRKCFPACLYCFK